MYHTTIPNIVFDLSTDLDPYSFKVLIYILRKTLGWHKQNDRISTSQLIKMTGLSKNRIKKSINLLIERQFIAQAVKGDGNIISEYYVTDKLIRDALGNRTVSIIEGVTVRPPGGHGMTPQKKLYKIK